MSRQGGVDSPVLLGPSADAHAAGNVLQGFEGDAHQPAVVGDGHFPSLSVDDPAEHVAHASRSAGLFHVEVLRRDVGKEHPVQLRTDGEKGCLHRLPQACCKLDLGLLQQEVPYFR
ncbi:hypothetical protein SDC9_66055 [bioreactor metagenome]|uniref:Uncharacterized protein n=1 Tax=bioreactor metagenome TaxID=1076179 RepID=A0A644XU65_9ZZZZ